MHYNLVNESLYGKMSSTNPEVGMCATMFVGSDRWPYVVTEVFTNKKIRVAMMSTDDYDSEKIVNGRGEEFLPSYLMRKYAKVSDDMKTIVPSGDIFTYRKNYRWMKEGSEMWGTGAIHLGKADEYRDPNF